MYVCYNCGKRIDLKNLTGEVLCPSCSGKIVFKEMSPTVKDVKAD